MALLLSTKAPCANASVAVQRRSVVVRRPVKVCVTVNGAQSKDDMNKAIGANIKRAAAQLGAARVWKMNKGIAKYIATAAEQAAAGKLAAKQPKSKK